VVREGRSFSDRAARGAVGGWAVAVALAGCPLGPAPAIADDPPEVHLVPGVVVTHARDHDPGPGGPPGDDTPRPVASRPTATVPAAAPDDGLAVRALRAPARVSVAAARRDGVAASFVPRPGSLVAEVRLVELRGGARRQVARRVVAAEAGRRVAAQLRAAGLQPGRYEVVVRAGATRRTLGAPVGAAVRIG
jgi:hypothetical protein